MPERISQDEALRAQLAAIAGEEPASSFFELRPLTPEGDPVPGDRAFIPIREIDAAMERIVELAPRLNVYIGAAPRTSTENGTTAVIERVHTLWADCDGGDALARLARFHPLPSIVIRTGSADHAHAYWPLREPVSPAFAKRANRRLAYALGADRGATDAARILRPCTSLNHKSTPPSTVRCTRLERVTFTVGEVIGRCGDDVAYLAPPPQPAMAPMNGNPDRALDGLIRTVAQATKGSRNHTLNWAAYRAGEHIAVGRLEEGTAIGGLRDAAISAGLGDQETERTIASGLAAGKEA